MKTNAVEISNYVFRATDQLLLDTNIWLLIFGPAAKAVGRRTRIYSKALGDMLASNCRIYIEVLILSEYVNRYARLKHNLLRTKPGISQDFKLFRKSSDFVAVASDIVGDVRQILKHCSRVDSEFAALDVGALVGEFEKGGSDLNDLVLTELCKSRNLTLVTDDADFKDRGLTVLTANKILLS